MAEAGSIRAVTEGDPARQSLISRQIRELETFFGTELTRRKGRGLEITDAGRELARQIRLQFQALHDFKQSHAHAPSEVRVASGGSILQWLVIPALAMKKTETEQLRWSMRVLRTREVVEALLDHTLDFGFIRQTAVVRPLKHHHLKRIGYALYAPGSWRTRNPADIFEHAPWALTAGGEFRRQLESAARKAGIVLNPTHICTSFTQAAQLVHEGLAAAVLPQMARLPEETRMIPLPWFDKQTRSIALVWHPRNLDVRLPLDAARRLLLDSINALPPTSRG